MSYAPGNEPGIESPPPSTTASVSSPETREALEALVAAILAEVGEPRVKMIGWPWEEVSISREAHKGGIRRWARDFAKRIAALSTLAAPATEQIEVPDSRVLERETAEGLLREVRNLGLSTPTESGTTSHDGSALADEPVAWLCEQPSNPICSEWLERNAKFAAGYAEDPSITVIPLYRRESATPPDAVKNLIQEARNTDPRAVEGEELAVAAAKVAEGFERGIFVRSTDNDSDPAWAIKLFPYLRALAALTSRAADEKEN